MSSTYKPSFMDVIKQLFQDITNTSGLVSTFFVLGLLTTIVSILVAVYYIYSMLDTIVQGMLLTTPLNMDTLEYNTMNSTQFFTLSSFNMWLFIVFPVLTVLWILIMAIVVSSKGVVLPTMIKYTAWILVAHNILFVIGYSIFFFRARYQHSLVVSRMKSFNQYVCQRIYRNTRFLNLLKTPQNDMISLMSIFTNTLKEVPINVKKDELAKVFYTLTLYYHYHKIGVRNPKIMGALSLFNPVQLLLKKCEPANYLNRYGTYIEDVSELIKQYLPPNLKQLNPEFIKSALDLSYTWMIQTNNLANSLYPEDALRPFITLTFINLTLQTISAIAISYFISDGERLRSFINKATNATQALVLGVSV